MTSAGVGGKRPIHRQPEPVPLSQAGGRYPGSPRSPPQESHRHKPGGAREDRAVPDTHLDSGGRAPILHLTLSPAISPPTRCRAAVPLRSLSCPLLRCSSQQRIHEDTSSGGQGPRSLAL